MTIRLLALRQPPPPVIQALEDGFALDIIADPEAQPDWTADDPASIRGLVNFSSTPLTGAVMDRLPALEVISSVGVGYDMIDVAAARARGIVVTHTPDVLNADVANYALLLLLAASRDLVRQDAHVRSGAWATQGGTPLTWSLEGETIGIVGLGRIGRTLAQKLGAFNCEVLYHGRSRQDVPYEFCPDLAAMARRCRAMVLLLPGGSGTDGLISAAVLEALGPDSGLVNVARGSVVDQTALIAALQDGRLGWAALDVFEDEPHVPDALRALPNVLLSPHAASATTQTRGAMFALVAQNIRAHFLEGAARSPVPECRDMIRR
ncbi:2-hydroxyacid dehydrogenase [Aestuariivita sp.]|jgi:lactate dehydrogenase-like 2-hydroxyacid dehydrogenase|uniref:2-hydroxyacid dehydrogenase n=1 Tax=Aestuariivita sp. TaxID=1872407 RepID=UPI002171886F|nr:2-hydroxyacid dehydrogenase [Aestuariivita sp.]MCE8008208.1 2-hydroxyacid dehydrogenase [Aestuariivita sp.]